MRLMKFFTFLITSVFSVLSSNIATASGDPACEYQRKYSKCVGCGLISQAFFVDTTGKCIACSGYCIGWSRPDVPVNESKSAKAITSAEPRAIFVVDEQRPPSDLNTKTRASKPRLFSDKVLLDIAAVNPEVASILHSIDVTPSVKVDLATGTAFSSALTTRESFVLTLAKADQAAIKAREQKISEDEAVRVEWRILESADGLASGLVTSHLLDKDERILKTAYPAVRLEFATGKNFRLLSWSVAE
jgi:hypothetical protein